MNARSRKVFGGPETFGDEVLHAASRLSLLGVTPPAFELIPHSPGAVSLSPPSNMESTALSSIVVGMLPASACQSVSLTPSGGVDTSPAGLASFPSPPWKLLPASGALVGVSANADEAPAASNSSAQAALRARRVQAFMRVVTSVSAGARGHTELSSRAGGKGLRRSPAADVFP